MKTKARELGSSWMEVDKEVHIFTGEVNEAHPSYASILRKL